MGVTSALTLGIGTGFAVDGGIHGFKAQLQSRSAERDAERCRDRSSPQRPGDSGRPSSLQARTASHVELADGRRFKVDGDRSPLAQWTAGDSIVASARLLLNRRTMTGVRAREVFGADEEEAETADAALSPAKMAALKDGGRFVVLSTGERFEVEASDRARAALWSLGALVAHDPSQATLIQLRSMETLRASSVE